MYTQDSFSAEHLAQAVAVTPLQETCPRASVTVFRKNLKLQCLPQVLRVAPSQDSV